MHDVTRTTRRIAAAFLLTLTIMFSSLPACATVISYDLSYTPINRGLGPIGDTFIDLTVFFDEADFAGTNGEFVQATRIDATLTFQGTASEAASFFTSISNTGTATVANPSSGAAVVLSPIIGQFFGATSPGEAGAFFGNLRGVQQSGITHPGLLSFGFDDGQGAIIGTDFFRGNPFGKGSDISVINGSGPFEVSSGTDVPEPATSLLFVIGLAGLAGFRRPRKAN